MNKSFLNLYEWKIFLEKLCKKKYDMEITEEAFNDLEKYYYLGYSPYEVIEYILKD